SGRPNNWDTLPQAKLGIEDEYQERRGLSTCETVIQTNWGALTTAVTEALRERLDRLRRERDIDRVERLLRIGRDCAAHLKKPFRSIDHGDMLYDDRGLPK